MTLTPKEVEIMELVKLGYENKQVGLELCVAEQTVKNYMVNIFLKLGALNRAHAVCICMKKGIVK